MEDAKKKLERSYHLSTACEHAFRSVVVATEELLIKNKYLTPEDHGERFRMFKDLHIRGYYRGTLSEKEAERCIIKDVKKLCIIDVEEASELC